MWAIVKNSMVILALLHANFIFAQSDYSKYRLFDSGYVDFTTKNTQFVSKTTFELPWLYQGNYDKVSYLPVGIYQANRYTFVQDTAGNLRYYADHAGVYSNRSGILFKSYHMNNKVAIPGCMGMDSTYPIPNSSKFRCGLQMDTLENFGYSNCVRFGKTDHYGIGIWDYQNNGFRLLRLSYNSINGDKVISSSILPNAGKFTTITCGPNDSSFWVVTMLENRHTIQVYLWTYSLFQFNQSIEIGDTSHLKAYAHRMKFSPDNSKMVLMKRYKNSTNIFGDQSNLQNTSYVFDFNSQSGIISNKQKISIYGNQQEFSPNSKYLYIKHIYSTMDSNSYFYMYNRPNPGYLSRYDLNTNSAKLMMKKPNGFLYPMQLMSDGNIYWINTVGANIKYEFERLENCNDSLIASFKKYVSDIDVVNAFRFRPNAVGYSIYPEIMPCKCYEPEPKPAKIEFCGKDTLIIQNRYKKYDSLCLDWGDGSFNIYKDIDSVFKHGYSYSGKYVLKINYRNKFQEFTSIDTIIAISNKKLNIPRDTFICPKDTLSLDLSVHDTNLIWSITSKSLQGFYQSGNFSYQYKDRWCNFEDSIHVVLENKPWNTPVKDTIICFGEKVSISVPSKFKIIWDQNQSDTNAYKEFTTTGTHELSFSDGLCSYVDSILVKVSSPMNLKVVQVDTTICHLLEPIEFVISGDALQKNSIFWNSEQTNSLQFATIKLSPIKISVIDTFGCKE